MDYNFSAKMGNLKPSAIREILKYTSGTDVIPFAAGNPSVEAFPVEEIRAITADILSRPPATYLQYGISEGYAPLRDWLKADLSDKNIKGEDDDLIIVSGAQQGIELAAKIFCDAGDTIVCENPSFIGSLNAFRSHGVNLAGVDMQEDGVDIDALEEAFRTQPNVKLFYTIPSFQNPTGITTSLEKRIRIYALARQYGVVILEDNPYGDLRFAGEDVPTLKSMDTDGRVIYCGSFSKLLAPGMRVGYVLADKNIIAKLTVVKQTSDVHTNLLAQITVHEFVSKYDLQAHIARIRSIYGRKYGLMKQGLEKDQPEWIRYTQPQGGLFVLAYLPQPIDVTGLCKACIENKLAIVPGSAFSIDPTETPHSVRLNFSTPSDEQLVAGCEIFNKVLRCF